MNIPENVITKKGPKPGPTVAIFCGVHGNERAGILAVDRLAQELAPIAGTIYFVYANPPAIEKNLRLIDINLNRLFIRVPGRITSVPDTYEYRRAAELMDLLDTCDALLDLHSYPEPLAPESAVPFAICESVSRGIATLFDVGVVVSGFSASEPGGSDGYMFMNGKPGVCVELGANECPEKFVDLGIDTIRRFLAHFGCLEPQPARAVRAQLHLTLSTFHKKTHDDFQFVRDFRNLEPIQVDEPIAVVNGLTLRAERDSHIIFPNASRAVGVEAFLLAREATTS